VDEERFLTPEGAAKLKLELEQLKGPRRKEMADRLRHAISQGDLSENADYISAKEDQAFLEGRILELDTLLRRATIVERDIAPDRVTIGTEVVVAEDGREAEVYQIVGAKEADPRSGRISHESPIGKAVLGKKVGETTVAETPGGQLTLKIIEIR
jgi:transcription elongation factor GreA